MKGIISIGLIAGVMLSIVGCGGGDGGVQTGTAYYVDSAVEGVRYECGSQTGVTGENGIFTFELGEGCTFYLGDVALREIEASFLHDGGTFNETDYEIGRLLQSLDEVGSLSDGIQLDPDKLKALKDKGFETLDAMLLDMSGVFSALGIDSDVVDAKGAKEHMLTSLLGGNTYYIVDKDAQGTYEIKKITFAADMASVDKEEEGDASERIDISLDGEKIQMEGNIFMIAEVEPEYILADVSSGNKYTGEIKLYLTKEAAEAYIATKTSDNGGHTDAKVEVTAEMVSEKTFYHAGVDSVKGMKIYRKFTFTKNAAGEDIVDLHLNIRKVNGMVIPKEPRLPYALIDGKIRIDTSAFYKMPPADGHSEYFIFTLQGEADGKWHLKKEVDVGQDGTIDGTFYPAWHTSEPSNFIE